MYFTFDACEKFRMILNSDCRLEKNCSDFYLFIEVCFKLDFLSIYSSYLGHSARIARFCLAAADFFAKAINVYRCPGSGYGIGTY